MALTYRTRIIAIVAGVVVGLAGCATSAPRPAKKVADTSSAGSDAAVAIEGFDGDRRLPDTAIPQKYGVTLNLDPAESSFSGTTKIWVDLAEETDQIKLHARDLGFDRVLATVGQQQVAGRVVEGKNGGITLALAGQIGPGRAVLKLDYHAGLGRQPHGLYRVKDAGRWYAFTQFEPLSARRAFPCFDEPRFKTPYQLTVVVPDGDQRVVANAPVAEHTRTVDGQVFRFAQTRPLPSYLVALAAGPLEVVDAPDGPVAGIELRAVTPRGKAGLAEYALRRAAVILKAQIAYFGIEFPFQKLDVVAVPNFAAGAMENVGLVTFRERLLLVDPDEASARELYGVQSVMAHEFAHMWFGNLVTPAWWNELWLNEAFATWMSTRTLTEVAPKLQADVDAVESSLDVMDADSLASARAIRQPIDNGGDVMNAFDGITYQKGRAVLQMLEAWIGEDAFQKGVHRYLQAHAYNTGSTTDLLNAWQQAADASNGIVEVMNSFLNQPGTPLIDVKPRCVDDDHTTLEIEQSRYLPAGSSAETDQQWVIPMCFRYSVHGHQQRVCATLDSAHKTIPLVNDGCPDWIYPNADEAGYYHWKLPASDLVSMVTDHLDELSLAEKVALLPHAKALVEADKLAFDDYLSVVEAMADQDHRVIVGQVLDALYSVEDTAVDASNRPAFTRWARSLMMSDATRLGFAPTSDDSTGDALIRPRVMRAAADLGRDANIRDHAARVAHQYLEDPTSVSQPQANLALDIAAFDGGPKLWAHMKQAVAQAPTPAARVATIGALGHFRDPELVGRSLELVLTDTLRSQDIWTLVGPTLGNPTTAAVTWDWFRDHFDAVVDKVGAQTAASFPWVGTAFCSKGRRQEVAEFFGDDAHRVTGVQRNLRQALESIDQCVRYRARVADEARTFLANHDGQSADQ